MTEIKSQESSQFFGKDGMRPFIGVVEDVNDPKQAGRVKVRCVGWHPVEKKGEEGLSTDDLPWARVSAPTTHAQQARVGSKHGLLPGCWVWGFWLDDDDTQKPMVCGSFPFTARASDRDTRQDDNKTVGKQSDDIEAYSKVRTNTCHPNTQVMTDKERGSKNFSDPTDPSGDAPSTDDSMSGECGERISANTKAKREELKKGEAGNSNSLLYAVTQPDGACGSVPHAQDDMQRELKERMPSKLSRFAFNDQVWNKFTGAHLNINGIMAQLSLDFCAMVQMILTQMKAFQQENVQRPLTAVTQGLAADRDGGINLIAETGTSMKDDIFHTIFTLLMEQMCGQMMSMIKEMDRQDKDEADETDGGGLVNPGDPCVSKQLMQNVAVLADKMLKESIADSEELIKSYNLTQIEITHGQFEDYEIKQDEYGGWSDFTPDEYASQMNQVLSDYQKAADAQVYEEEEESSESGGSEFASILSSLGAVTSILQFSSMNKYAIIGSRAHSYVGNATQSKALREGGCKLERVYNTVQGRMSSMAAGTSSTGSGKGSQGNGEDSNLTNNRLNKIQNLGFGGLSSSTNPSYSTKSCNSPTLDDSGTGKDGTQGKGGSANSISLPSGDACLARNFDNGTPNQIIVTSPGKDYYNFPSIYIPDYNGTPVPVINSNTGSLLGILTNCNSWNPNRPDAPVSILPDNNSVGIDTIKDERDFDFVLGGVFIGNTGFGYCEPVIKIIDSDTGEENGEVKVVMREQRIIDIQIINTGNGYKSTPRIVIEDDCGYGAKLYAIISVVPKPEGKGFPLPVNMIYCPAKNQKNYSV